MRNSGYLSPGHPRKLVHGGTVLNLPSPPSPDRCRWGCFGGGDTAAGPSLSAASAEGAGRPSPGAGGTWSICAGFLVGLSRRSRSPSCSHSRRAADRADTTLTHITTERTPASVRQRKPGLLGVPAAAAHSHKPPHGQGSFHSGNFKHSTLRKIHTLV